MRVIATAGHVDHGKSSLVQALTGTDPDRLVEEKQRGLTIDLGFAHTVIEDEAISFVDVPGHVRFLRNMLAGVGGVDACLFVIAATEGWKPQSEEHLRILELLGVSDGVVALTKVDLLGDDELVELATLELAERLAGSFLAGAPIVPVAAPSWHGARPVGRRARRAGSPDAGRRRPRPSSAVGRPRLRRQGQRHRGHRHPDRRGAGDRRSGRRRAPSPSGPDPCDPDPRRVGRAHRARQSRRPQPGRASTTMPSPGATPWSNPVHGGRRNGSTPR